jgi:hypothetical protein
MTISSAERELLDETVRGALAGAAANADAVLAEVGWLEMLDAEPDDAIAIVFGALGATNGSSTALDDVVCSALGVTTRADLAVLLPAFGVWDPPPAAALATERVAKASQLLVVRRTDGGLRAITVATASATTRRVRGVDPDAGIHAIDLLLTPEQTRAGEPLDADAWDAAVALARRALAHEMAGASRTMLELAAEHARTRVQFGRAIGSFQAVRHRLAEALVAIEALDATLRAAADEPNPMTAALAKATAGRTARTVASHCQQVLAGIGFTTDHPFHRFLKRTLLLDGLFGSADAITVDLGRRLIADRRVPTLVEL